jgi:hypothetical protein
VSPIAILIILNFALICVLLLKSSLSRRQRHCTLSDGGKPVVEFFLHGRGSGHWTGSWGLMEVLMEKGYDLRVYATKPMPPFAKRASPIALTRILRGEKVQDSLPAPSFVNYTLVDVLLPGMSLFQVLSVLWKRVPRWSGDPRPLVIISDGDFPGALQSYLYGIPSIHTTHGQMFAGIPPPSTLPKALIPSWDHQARLNGRNSMWTTYEVGFNPIPFVGLESVPRPRVRNVVRDMARQRHARIQAYQGLPQHHRPLVVTYFRDENGAKTVEMLLRESVDVVVFGSVPQLPDSLPGKLIPVGDPTYFVQFMGIADGVAGSGGCILQAECAYALIPLLSLYLKDDTEHELNVYMGKQVKLKNGNRLIFGMSFEDLAIAKSTPEEIQLFLDRVRKSDASTSFFEAQGQDQDSSSFLFRNELLDDIKESSDRIVEILEKERQKSKC